MAPGDAIFPEFLFISQAGMTGNSKCTGKVGGWVKPRQAITRSFSHLRGIYFRYLWHMKQPSKTVLSISQRI